MTEKEENHISDKLYATLHVKKGQLPDNRPFALKIRNKTNVDVTVNESLTKKAQKKDNHSSPG